MSYELYKVSGCEGSDLAVLVDQSTGLAATTTWVGNNPRRLPGRLVR